MELIGQRFRDSLGCRSPAGAQSFSGWLKAYREQCVRGQRGLGNVVGQAGHQTETVRQVLGGTYVIKSTDGTMLGQQTQTGVG